MDNLYKQNRDVLTNEIASINNQAMCVWEEDWTKSEQECEKRVPSLGKPLTEFGYSFSDLMVLFRKMEEGEWET